MLVLLITSSVSVTNTRKSSLTAPIYSYVGLGEESGNLMAIAIEESLL